MRGAQERESGGDLCGREDAGSQRLRSLLPHHEQDQQHHFLFKDQRVSGFLLRLLGKVCGTSLGCAVDPGHDYGPLMFRSGAP